MQIGLDGSTNSTQLSSSDKANLFPGSLVPDGNGGIVATWTIVNTQLPVAPLPYQAAYVMSGSVVSTYPLPMAPTQVVNGSNGLPINPTFVVGQNNTAVASYGTNLTSFSFSSGSANWNYSGSGQNSVSLDEFTSDGGLTINDAAVGAVQLDPSGNILGSASYLQGLLPFTMTSWVGFNGAGLADVLSPNGSNSIPNTVLPTSWPAPGGDPQSQHQPPFCQRQNSHCVLAPDSDGPQFYLAPLREVQYKLFSLQNGVLKPISQNSIQTTRIVLYEDNASNAATTIRSLATIQGGGCQSPTPNCTPGSGSACDPLGVFTDRYSAGVTGPNIVTQHFFVDRGNVQVFWPQRYIDNNIYWYGAYSQTAAVDAVKIPQGGVITQIPPLSNGVSCPTGCSFTQTNGIVLTQY